jgi:RNA polymerase sigma-70 factor (ECF subfamily)
MFEDLRVGAGQVIVDEAMLLARAEEDQLELAVRQYAQLVYRISYSVLRNHHDAEDATQETFVRVLRARRNLAKVDDPKSWLARIAWRVAVDRRRKSTEVPLESATEEAVSKLQAHLASAEEGFLGQEMSEILDVLVAALPSRLRDPLTLSTVQELSPAEIAKLLGMGEAAVRSRIFRARQLLKGKLQQMLKGNHAT